MSIESVREQVRRMLVEGRLGELELSSWVDEVRRVAGEAEGMKPWSRKNPQPAILKYGWVQFFLDETSMRVEGIGIYPTLTADDRGRLIDRAFAEFLLEAQPFDIAEIVVVPGCSIVQDAYYEHISEDPYRGEALDLSSADYVSVCVPGGGEAIFHSLHPSWRLQKMLFFRGFPRVAQIPTVF